MTVDLTVLGRLVNASNDAMLVERDGTQYIYKPVSGERPLWDFPEGTLANRERAAYVVSSLLGWDLVPPTELVEGPSGLGSLQLWIEGDITAVDVVPPHQVPPGWITVLHGFDEDRNEVALAHADDDGLRRLAIFDALVNNGDRKAGHILTTSDGHHYGIDNGVSFNVDPKLRTVLWGFIDQPIEQSLIADVEVFIETLSSHNELNDLLDPDEIFQLELRAQELVTNRIYPTPSPQWPAIPWPVF